MYVEKSFALPLAPEKRRSRIAGFWSMIAVLILSGLGVDAGVAAQPYAGEVQTKYQYAAKVLCSLLRPHQDGDLAQGAYRTAINVHNPTDEKVTAGSAPMATTRHPRGEIPERERD